MNRSVATHMAVPLWRTTYEYLDKMLKTLENNQSIVLQEADEPERV
jgi:hypothetical protein